MTLTLGTLVQLRFNPFGEPGKVIGFTRGKAVVEWSDLGMTAKHPPESLVLVPQRATVQANETKAAF